MGIDEEIVFLLMVLCYSISNLNARKDMYRSKVYSPTPKVRVNAIT